jgi:hypothetical protein
MANGKQAAEEAAPTVFLGLTTTRSIGEQAMAKHAHSTPAARGLSPEGAASRRRVPPASGADLRPFCGDVIRPNYMRRAMAYVANGDRPPLALEFSLAFTVMAALCFAAGLVTGGAL